ncbi:hypothetical protein ABTX86_34590, partial [Streptomyces anulatus]|uniref:phosphotransferase-like protein n=1 Tax=Streptomyces anulatus TaxID=1892 RepID=UPI00334B7BB3
MAPRRPADTRRTPRNTRKGPDLPRRLGLPLRPAVQADTVHRGVVYDLEVDTTRTEALACARKIAT